MTEKDYSGATTSKIGKNAKASMESKTEFLERKEKKNKESKNSYLDIENYRKAGQIMIKVKNYARTIIKSQVPLLEIAEKIEAEIKKLGGELAFPVNLSIDDVAAHYTPNMRDETKAQGLLSIDIGVSINGCIADSAFSLDLSHEKKYSKLIEASERALEKAIEYVKLKKDKAILSEIGKIIQTTISSYGFSPIRNLSGHGLDEFQIHSGITIPNYENHNMNELGEGAFAIEPFATTGEGIIYESSNSGIYHLSSENPVRDSLAREVLNYILETKKTLPFSQRELERKFGSRVLFAILNLKKAGVITEYEQLVEKSHKPVSQAETSFIIRDGKVEVLC